VFGGELETLGGRPRLEASEALLELVICGLERSFRVDIQVTPHVGEGEEKISQLLGGATTIPRPHGLTKLAPFLLHLRE
jgi:hypothetical protein